MESKKMMLIINPKSGVNAKEAMASDLRDSLASDACEVDMRFTKRRGHATALAQEAIANGYSAVVVCGGDGTVNETASALCGTALPLGIIPSGSGNGLARHLGIPIDEFASLEVIKEGKIIDCDCGMANGRRFFCTYGLGFDAYVSHLFSEHKRRGRITYLKIVMAEFSKYQPRSYRISVNDEIIEREAFVVAICNASQYGNNAFIAPGASVSDGSLDLVIVKSPHPITLLQAGMDMLTGMMQHNPHVETIRASHIEIETDPDAWAHIDGEPLQVDSGKVVVDCVPHAVKAFANPHEQKFHPFITPIDLTLRDWGFALRKLLRLETPS